jgi:hypothetical protein
MRNAKNNYNLLEKLFGTLTAGCGFGESCMFGSDSSSLQESRRFFTPIALTESYYMCLRLKDYHGVIKNIEDKILKD